MKISGKPSEVRRRAKQAKAAPNDRVGIAWSPVILGSGFVSTQQQAESFYDGIKGTKKFNLSSSRDRPSTKRLRKSQFGATGRLNKVDLLYFAGHGFQDGLRLDDGDSSTHDEFVETTDIQNWGSNDGLKWVTLDACDTLNTGAPPDPEATKKRWGAIFNGLHGLLGFASPILNWPGRGDAFSELLERGESVLQAWKMVCEETEGATDPSTTYLWACLRVTAPDTANDRWNGDRAKVPTQAPTSMELTTRPC